MAKFTNTAPGPRGVNLKSGATHWIEPGETADLDEKDVADAHPDLDKGAKAAKEADKPAT